MEVRVLDFQKTRYFDPYENRSSGRYPELMPYTGMEFDMLYPDMLDADFEPLTPDSILRKRMSLAGFPGLDFFKSPTGMVFGAVGLYALWKIFRK